VVVYDQRYDFFDQNGQWRLVDSPVAESLNRVQMLSAGSGWALGGSRRDPTTSVLLRYQNGAWQPIPSPALIPLTDMAMVSETEGWAVGGDYFQVPFGCAGRAQSKLLNALLHYQDGIWTSVTSPSSEMMQGISMLDADNGLLVGRGVVLRYAEGRWQAVKLEPLP
jgi:hypothetical protein